MKKTLLLQSTTGKEIQRIALSGAYMAVCTLNQFKPSERLTRLLWEYRDTKATFNHPDISINADDTAEVISEVVKARDKVKRQAESKQPKSRAEREELKEDLQDLDNLLTSLRGQRDDINEVITHTGNTFNFADIVQVYAVAFIQAPRLNDWEKARNRISPYHIEPSAEYAVVLAELMELYARQAHGLSAAENYIRSRAGANLFSNVHTYTHEVTAEFAESWQKFGLSISKSEPYQHTKAVQYFCYSDEDESGAIHYYLKKRTLQLNMQTSYEALTKDGAEICTAPSALADNQHTATFLQNLFNLADLTFSERKYIAYTLNSTATEIFNTAYREYIEAQPKNRRNCKQTKDRAVKFANKAVRKYALSHTPTAHDITKMYNSLDTNAQSNFVNRLNKRIAEVVNARIASERLEFMNNPLHDEIVSMEKSAELEEQEQRELLFLTQKNSNINRIVESTSSARTSAEMKFYRPIYSKHEPHCDFRILLNKTHRITATATAEHITRVVENVPMYWSCPASEYFHKSARRSAEVFEQAEYKRIIHAREYFYKSAFDSAEVFKPHGKITLCRK